MRKKKNTGVIVSIFLAVLMVSSIAGYIANQNSGSIRYKGKKFTQTTDGWKTTIDGQTHYFAYAPPEVESIDFPSMNLQSAVEIDMTYDPLDRYKESIAQSLFELSSSLGQKKIYLRQGFTSKNEFGLPIITCNDSSATVPVISFRDSNTTGIRQENNCLIVESNNDQSFRFYADRIAYHILGVI